MSSFGRSCQQAPTSSAARQAVLTKYLRLVYKPYIDVSQADRDRVRTMQAEAAALDQDETRSETP